MRRLLPIVALCSLADACGHMGPRALPLYPGPVRPAQDVATLTGPIKSVDGLDVSDQGTVFALEPGCHVVALQPKIGEGGVGGAWSFDIPNHIYAFRMTAGNSYVVDVRVLPGNQGVGKANVGDIKVTAVERDSRGGKVATIPRVRSEADVDACHAWAARSGSKPQASAEALDEEAEGAGRAPVPVANPDGGAVAPDAQAAPGRG